MPRLLRGMARTAVVAGTATAVSGRVSRRQARRWSADEPQAAQGAQPVAEAPAQAAMSMDDKAAQLETLAGLKEKGILTDAEFQAQKSAILGS